MGHVGVIDRALDVSPANPEYGFNPGVVEMGKMGKEFFSMGRPATAFQLVRLSWCRRRRRGSVGDVAAKDLARVPIRKP